MLTKPDLDTLSQAFPELLASDADLGAELARAGRAAELPAGAFVFHDGDPCEQVGFVLDGAIRVYKAGASGREITLYHVVSGELCMLNVSCVLSHHIYPATAVVETPLRAVLVSGACFRKWVAQSESLRKLVFSLMSSRFAEVVGLVEQVAFARTHERLADFLAERLTVGRLDMTHEQIAAELGSSREVITRLLHDLERSGAVELSRGHVALKNPERLAVARR